MREGLSPDEVALVIRRAAELDTPELGDDRLALEAVRHAGREVGLSEQALDQAVAEWHRGLLQPPAPLCPSRLVGLDGQVVVEHVVAGDPADVAHRVDGWLRSQWFERCRLDGLGGRWAPREGALANARRLVDLNRRLRLRDVRAIDVLVTPAATGTRVRLVADVRPLRNGLLAGRSVAPAAAVAALVVLSPVVPVSDPMPELLLAALPAGGVAASLGWVSARAALHRRSDRLSDELTLAIAELPAARSALPR